MQPIESFGAIQALFVAVYYALGGWTLLFLLAEIFAGQFRIRRRAEPKPAPAATAFQPRLVSAQNWIPTP